MSYLSEMVLDHSVTLHNDTIVMSVPLFLSVSTVNLCGSRVWISSSTAAKVIRKGYRIVHAPSDYFYLVWCNMFIAMI